MAGSVFGRIGFPMTIINFSQAPLSIASYFGISMTFFSDEVMPTQEVGEELKTENMDIVISADDFF